MSAPGKPWQPREQAAAPKEAAYASARLIPKKTIKPFSAKPAVPAVLNPKNWDPELVEDQLDLFGGETS